MKRKRLLHAFGNVDDKYIEEAAPQLDIPKNQRTFSTKRILFRFIPITASIVIFLLATTVLAANYIQSSISSFYLRYLSPPEMAVADSIADQYGAQVYFDGLKSGDIYKQYFSINKLVEYYNDEKIRLGAIRAITPFLDSSEEKLSTTAAFALSVLKKEFDDPHIIRMADEVIIFTLFNDYSDYGSYNQIWMIKDGILSEFASFNPPKLYITQIVPSPDKKLFAVTFCSNKSEYLMICDLGNGMVSPELIDSARFMIAKNKGYTLWQRVNNENYSGLSSIEWLDNDWIAFQASLSYNGAEIVEDVAVRYSYQQKQMEYNYITN